MLGILDKGYVKALRQLALGFLQSMILPPAILESEDAAGKFK
jgi:hypothetical protein